MSGNLTIVAKYGTPEEAHLIRNRLEAAGIRAFLEGEVTSAWAWHFANALGGVKVLVPEEDAGQAEKILDSLRQEVTAPDARPEAGPPTESAADAWACPNCQAEVDADLDVCWSCGTTADGGVGPAVHEAEAEAEHEPEGEAEPDEREPPPPDVAFLMVLFPPTFAYFLFSKLCALLAPLVPDVTPRAPARGLLMEAAPAPAPDREVTPVSDRHVALAEPPDAAAEEDLDALVLRAWRAALMGFFLLPPLLMSLYSTWLLVQYWLRRRSKKPSRDRRAVAALCINVIAASVVGLLLWLAVADLFSRIWEEPAIIGPVEPEPPSDFGP